jgi:uncharacterized membrane protein (UPF0127 family)
VTPLRLSAAVALALVSIRCSAGGAPAADGPRVVVETARGGRHVVSVEIARTEAERAKGLMHRRSLAPDAGMLFVFDETAHHPFWMMNTHLALDLLFIDEDGRIAGIAARARPGDLSPISAAPSRYVLEVNGGWAESHGVAVGDRVRFENVRLY